MLSKGRTDHLIFMCVCAGGEWGGRGAERNRDASLSFFFHVFTKHTIAFTLILAIFWAGVCVGGLGGGGGGWKEGGGGGGRRGFFFFFSKNHPALSQIVAP